MKKLIPILLILLLALSIFLFELSFIPSSLDRILTDPTLDSSFPTSTTVISFETYSLIQLGLRCLVNAIFWVAAGLVFLQTFRQTSPVARVGLLTSALLISLPIQVLWSSLIWVTTFPGSWQTILLPAFNSTAFLSLLLLLYFYFIFPQGRFQPPWLAWVVGMSSLLLAAVSIILAVNQSTGEALFLIGIFGYFTCLVAGVINLWLRRKRQPSTPVLSADRHALPDQPTIDPTVQPGSLPSLTPDLDPAIQFAMQPDVQPGALPAWLALAVSAPLLALILSSFQNMLSSLLTLFLVASLPSALIIAILRGELWPVLPGSDQAQVAASNRRRSMVIALLILGIGLLSFLAAARKAEISPQDLRSFELFITKEPLPIDPSPRPVIIDTDMAYDDWIAILYVLQRPELSVKAITVAGTGESHCEPGVRNALALIRLAGQSGIPVACGREAPLQGQQVFPAEWRLSSDQLNNLVIPDGENTSTQLNPETSLTAPELIGEVVKNSPEKVVLLALGPLTNLGEAVQQEPGFLKNISQIYIMGGALEVLGNVHYSGIDNQVAEWNIFIDPLALKNLLAAGAPLTLVPLDATNQVPANLNFYRLLQANQTTPEARFVLDLMRSELNVIASGINSFWDPLTAAILADENLGSIRSGNLKVFTQEGPSFGLTRIMADGAPVRYVRSVNPWRFYADLVRTLNQP